MVLFTTPNNGLHRVEWNGTNNEGVDCASGIYFAVFVIGKRKEMKKMILVR